MPNQPGLPHGKNLVLLAALVGGIAVVLVGAALVIALSQDSNEMPDNEVANNSDDATNGDDSQRTTEVDLSIEAGMVGSRLAIEGDVTVPDGAYVLFEVTGPEDCEECHATGRLPVSGERFQVSIDVSGWPDADYRVWVAFQTVLPDAEQPSHVLELYGENGEHMAGDTVEADGYTRVEAETTVSR